METLDKAAARKALRKEKIAAREALSPEERAEKSRAICANILQTPEYAKAKTVFIYKFVKGEVQLKALEEPRALLENKPAVPLPNDASVRTCRGATAAEIGFILGEAGCGFCLDVGHAVCAANSQGLEPYAYVAELARRFAPAMFHLSDVADMSSRYDAHPHLGTGALDIPRLVRTVFPPDAAISIETVKDSPADLDDFVHDARSLRNA